MTSVFLFLALVTLMNGFHLASMMIALVILVVVLSAAGALWFWFVRSQD